MAINFKMRLQIFLSICVVHTVFTTNSMTNTTLNRLERINSDKEARPGQFPFIASIRTTAEGIHFCAGAIVSEQYILTNGICVDKSIVSSPEEIQAVVGSNRILHSGVVHDIIEIHRHQKYKTPEEVESIEEFQYYVGLLVLKENIITSDTVRIVALPKIDLPKYGGTTVVVAAWGKKKVGNYTEMLRFAETTTMRLDSRLPGLVETSRSSNIGDCLFDLGAPLINNAYELVGIALLPMECNGKGNDPYVRVYPHIGWIEGSSAVNVYLSRNVLILTIIQMIVIRTAL